MTDSLSRRQFVARAAALGAGVMVLPRHVLGGVGAPSRTLNVAMIGGGGMGSSNASALVAGGRGGNAAAPPPELRGAR